MIELTLPYPISANRYWRPVNIGNHITIVPTKEAKDYKRLVASLVYAAGIRQPIAGRIAISVQLFPHRPLDWKKRVAKDPLRWDDTVQCLDLDNANKVLLDAFKGVAIEDDKWVRELRSERMEPDEVGARVIVRILRIDAQSPQSSFLSTATIAEQERRERIEELPF